MKITPIDNKTKCKDIIVNVTIVKNRVKCSKCKDIIESKHRHDFEWCSCRTIAVDGGKDYLKRSGDIDNCKEMSTFSYQCNVCETPDLTKTKMHKDLEICKDCHRDSKYERG